MRMTKTAILSMTCTMFYSMAHADTAENLSEPRQNPHRFYIGPDLFYMRDHINEAQTKVKLHGFLGGVKAGYDYLKPKAIYAGVDGLYAFGRERGHIEYYSFDPYSGHNIPYIDYSMKYKSRTRFAHTEARLGYNFQAGSRSLITPFLGLGGYYSRSTSSWSVEEIYIPNSTRLTSSWGYYALGMRTFFTIRPSFDLGLILKGMRSFSGRIKFESPVLDRKGSLANSWGYEIDLPLTWHLGATKQWDIQLEPYFLKLSTKDNLNIFGGRLLLGYRF